MIQVLAPAIDEVDDLLRLLELLVLLSTDNITRPAPSQRPDQNVKLVIEHTAN